MSFAISSFSPSYHLGSWLFTLTKPIHPLLVLLKVLGNTEEGKKLEAKAIGTNEALDSLLILMISPTPYTLKSTDNSVSEYINSHKWLKNTSTFQDTFPGAARYSFCLCWCTVPEPHGRAVTAPFSGVGAWGSDHRHLAEVHKCTQKMAEREQELKRFWFGPKSLVISLHE